MASPKLGDKAPDFELALDSGQRFRLSAQHGRPVVLYFYPEDDTEGCTIENIEFTAELPAFAGLGAKLIGISPDSVEKHCRFRDKYALAVSLAADPAMAAISAYGVWGPKTSYGREYTGLIRTTFLIAPDGTIAGIYPVKRIKGHAAHVLEETRKLLGATA